MVHRVGSVAVAQNSMSESQSDWLKLAQDLMSVSIQHRGGRGTLPARLDSHVLAEGVMNLFPRAVPLSGGAQMQPLGGA